jgi:hypothetical protein
VLGVTEIEDRAGAVTCVLPEIPLKVAEMVDLPVVKAVTTPLLFTVATTVLLDPQLACAVIFCVPPPA